MQELAKRLRELKPYQLPDPADGDATVPLGSSMVGPADGKAGGDGKLGVLFGPQAELDSAMRRMAGRTDEQRVKKLNVFINRARKASRSWEQNITVKVRTIAPRTAKQLCCFRTRKHAEDGRRCCIGTSTRPLRYTISTFESVSS